MANKIEWQWLPSNNTPCICAVVAWYDIAQKLISHLLERVDESNYSHLQLVISEDVIILSGEASYLPWIDGIGYATIYPNEQRLWLPSNVLPSVALDLLAEAFYQRYQIAPLLLWNKPKTVIPLNNMQPVTKYLLEILKARYLSKI